VSVSAAEIESESDGGEVSVSTLELFFDLVLAGGVAGDGVAGVVRCEFQSR
jgi:low temperature requirement protein LtrA